MVHGKNTVKITRVLVLVHAPMLGLGGVLRERSQGLGSITVMMVVVMMLVVFTALVSSHLLMVRRSRGARRVSVRVPVIVLVSLDDHDNNATFAPLLAVFAIAAATTTTLTMILSILARLQSRRRRRFVVLANTLDGRLYSNTLISTTTTLVM